MRILVVEDDERIANALKKGLENESFSVDVAYNGEDGMGFAQTIEYDLIILDRMLPGIKDGLVICRVLREEGNKTPILVLTARDSTEEKVEGLNLEVDDYMIKPFSFIELVARVRALLRRQEKYIGNQLIAKNLTLDTVTHEVLRLGEPIELSPTEYKIFEYLMRSTGQTLSKEKIIGHVWDFDAEILPNTVEAHIRSLRKKLDRPDEGASVIQTIRGFGYRITK